MIRLFCQLKLFGRHPFPCRKDCFVQKHPAEPAKRTAASFGAAVLCSGYSALYALPMIHGLLAEYFAWLRR